MAINHRVGVPGFPGAKTNSSTIPAPVTRTGTITHSNVSKLVTGTGTLFKSECKVGDYIYANSEVREIVDIESDTRLLVKTAFGADLVGVALNVVESGKYRHVGVKNSGAADGTLFGNSFPVDEIINFNAESGLAPVVYNATGTTFLISTVE